MDHPIIPYILAHQDLLLYRDFLQELFMIPERLALTAYQEHKGIHQGTLSTPSPLYKNKLVVYNNRFYALSEWTRIPSNRQFPTYQVIVEPTDIPHNPKETQPLLTPQTEFLLTKGIIENFTSTTPITATIGEFIINAVLIVPLFHDKVPYINEELTPNKYGDLIKSGLLNKIVDPEKVKTVGIDNYYFLLSHPEMFAPNLTEKALTTFDDVDKVREEEIAKRKDRLEQGDPTAGVEIEQVLQAKDKDRLKGDPSLHYFLGKKAWGSRKKLLLTTGVLEKFGSPGEYTYVPKPLGTGWDMNYIPTMFNESRLGSQSRALETAKGGEEAKFLSRVLQDLYVVMADCKTKKGVVEFISKYTVKEQYDRYIMEGGKEILLTEENAGRYIGKNVTLRSPLFCVAQKGFCARCMGRTFEALGQTSISTPAKNMSATLTTAALKRMHSSSVDLLEIGNLAEYRVKT